MLDVAVYTRVHRVCHPRRRAVGGRDGRRPRLVRHTLQTVVRQGVFQIARGNADQGDADALRTDTQTVA